MALFSALVFKLTRLYEHPPLEASLLFIFAYLPYLLAEALNLSGIMAILFCGVAGPLFSLPSPGKTTHVGVNIVLLPRFGISSANGATGQLLHLIP